jgi:hypothetical protein
MTINDSAPEGASALTVPVEVSVSTSKSEKQTLGSKLVLEYRPLDDYGKLRVSGRISPFRSCWLPIY